MSASAVPPSSPDDLAALYDAPPSWLQRSGAQLVPWLVGALTVALTVLAFPPFSLPEMAYICLAPGVLWAYRRPGFRTYAWTMLGASVVAWTILLHWLHHVTWLGWLLLGPVTGLWVGSWFLLAWWVTPRLLGRPALTRIALMLALAGAWVVIEWTRTWVLTGFPWLPLAASQWTRPSILQIAAYTGAGGVSFVLVAMNFAFAAYSHRLFFERARGLQKRSQEFFAAMFLLLTCLSVHLQETFNRGRFSIPFLRAGLVQPAIPQSLKWDPAEADAILRTLERTTLDAVAGRPDVLFWPEATTPLAVRGDDPRVQAWTEDLVRRARRPLLLGSIAVENPEAGAGAEWFNGAFVVDPEFGLQRGYYAKRHLVPFGEYVPLRSSVLGWLDKVVPVGGDFSRGRIPAPLHVTVDGRSLSLGAIICYEDIFPDLARASVRDGADALVVLTNNAWYGESGAAEQHATHSVLRAVETRRPVLRVGNSGWSGWIDEFGTIRAVVRQTPAGEIITDPVLPETMAATIYFRGAATIEVKRDFRWLGRTTFYARHGDWFIGLAAGLGLFGWALVRYGPPPETPVVENLDTPLI